MFSLQLYVPLNCTHQQGNSPLPEAKVNKFPVEFTEISKLLSGNGFMQ